MSPLRVVNEAPLGRGRRVIVRADFDVLTADPRDNFKIKECLPTLRYLLKKGAFLRIISHLGRPQGKKVKSLSLKRLRSHLEKLLRARVIFIANPLDRKSFEKYSHASEIMLFENIRFFKAEEKNDMLFARRLSRWGDLYVNEAFADSHRPHASMMGLVKLLPHFAGFRLATEVFNLTKVLSGPRYPLVAVLGGKKLETKLPLIRKFLFLRGEVLLGGALANSLFHGRGLTLGRSLTDGKLEQELRSIREHQRLFLPLDFRAAEGAGNRIRITAPDKVKEKETIYDIGPRTMQLFASRIRRAKTILWNGPMGLAEDSRFSYGTRGIARSIQKTKAFKVVGGGDTVATLRRYGLLDGFSHVSTGGGAMLEFLVGKKLPGIEALKNLNKR